MDALRLTTRSTAFLLDSCISPPIISSSRILTDRMHCQHELAIHGARKVCNTHSISLLKVEDQIQFTNVPKVAIQYFDVSVYDLQRKQFVIARGD